MYTGITSAFFKLFGKVPSSKALFIMFEITGAICKEACFSKFWLEFGHIQLLSLDSVFSEF